MKQFAFLLIVLSQLIPTKVAAQDSDYITSEYNKTLATYQLAQKYNDQQAMKQSLLELLVLNNQDTTVLRALSEFYYNNRNFTSSALVGLDFLEKHPGNLIATEVVALSYEQLRLYDKAIEYYQPIWIETQNVNVLYQISFLQYSLKRYNEALNNLNTVESLISSEDKIQLTASNGMVQYVSFKAAVLNLKGLIAIDEGDNDQAKIYLLEALLLEPEFEAAQNTYDSINN